MNTSLNPIGGSFIDLMEQLVSQYWRLADLLLQEEQAIVAFSIQTFHRVREEKQIQIVRIQAIDSKRKVFLKKLAAEWGIPSASLTLSTIAERMEPPLAERIRHLSAELKVVLDIVAERNRKNDNLIGYSLALIRSSIDFLTHLMIPAPVYGKNGGVVPSKGSGLRLRSMA